MRRGYRSILLVGAGPAGSSLALRLHAAGWQNLLVIDKSTFPREKVCGDYLNPAASGLLETLPGFSLSSIPERVILRRLELVSPGNRSLVGPFNVGSPGHGLKREVLDAALVHAARQQGITVKEGVRFVEPVIEQERLVGARLEEGGHATEHACDLIVGADGLHSNVASGIEVRPKPPGRVALVARLTVERAGADAFMFLGPEADLGICPVGPHTINAGFLISPERLKIMTGTQAERFRSLWHLMPAATGRFGGCGEVIEVRGAGPFGFRKRPHDVAGMALIGDALGFRDPISGNGVERALLASSLLAEKLNQGAAFGPRTLGTELDREFGWRRIPDRLLLLPYRGPLLDLGFGLFSRFPQFTSRLVQHAQGT